MRLIYFIQLIKILMTIKERVEWVLDRFQQARNDDNLLVTILWESFYIQNMKFPILDTVELYSVMKELPKATDIVRWRQKIQSEGKFLPTTQEVAEKRKKHIVTWKRDLGYSA